MLLFGLLPELGAYLSTHLLISGVVPTVVGKAVAIAKIFPLFAFTNNVSRI
jgi:hypothetical protein